MQRHRSLIGSVLVGALLATAAGVIQASAAGASRAPGRSGSFAPLDHPAHALSPGASGNLGNSRGTPPLRNPNNNPVQHHPRVYMIVWGPSYDATTRNDVSSLLSSLGNSGYARILDQYSDSTDFVHPDTTFVASFQDPTPPVGTVDITAALNEINKAVTINGWSNSTDTQFLLLLPNGTPAVAPDGSAFCAYHSFGSPTGGSATYIFDLVPWLGEAPFSSGCLSRTGGSVPLATTLAVSHEWAEAATDPFIDAWRTSDAAVTEVADLCEDYNGVSGFGVSITYLWDNISSTCTTSLVAPFNAGDGYSIKMDQTGSTEIHALYGANDYQSFRVEVGTALGTTNPANWAFVVGTMNGNGLRDIIAICMQVCGSGHTEIHILDGGTNYQSYKAHIATVLGPTNPSQWAWALGHNNPGGLPDVIGILMNGTGSGRTEVHDLYGVNNYQSFKLEVATALPQTDPSHWKFLQGSDANSNGIPDLTGIFMTGGSGRTEVHTLYGVTNYSTFKLEIATVLGQTDPVDFAFGDSGVTAGNGIKDILVYHLNGFAGTTEVHVLSGASNYQSFPLEIWSALPSVSPLHFNFGSSSWYSGIADFSMGGGGTMTVPRGGSASEQITLSGNNAFLGGVSFSTSGVPSGSSARVSPGSVTVNPDQTTSATLTVNVGTLQLTSFTVTITACGNGVCHSENVPVTVQVV